MRGYCAYCREYRSDDGIDAWKIVWRDGVGVCEKCGSMVELWRNGGIGSPAPIMDEGENDNA